MRSEKIKDRNQATSPYNKSGLCDIKSYFNLRKNCFFIMLVFDEINKFTRKNLAKRAFCDLS